MTKYEGRGSNAAGRGRTSGFPSRDRTQGLNKLFYRRFSSHGSKSALHWSIWCSKNIQMYLFFRSGHGTGFESRFQKLNDSRSPQLGLKDFVRVVKGNENRWVIAGGHRLAEKSVVTRESCFVCEVFLLATLRLNLIQKEKVKRGGIPK